MKPVLGGSLWFRREKFFHCRKQCSQTGTEPVLLRPLLPPLIYELWIPCKKTPESKEAMNKCEQASKSVRFCKVQSRKWFQERNNFCSILTHWMSSFFPLWHHCQQCPWQKRNIDRSLKWVPSSSSWESPAELPDSQTRAPSTIKTGRRIESFFLLLAGLRGCSLAKLTQVLSWEI